MPDWPRRRKLGLILADLHEAGWGASSRIAKRGPLWRGFLDRLESVALTEREEEALCPRAAAVFVLFVTACAGLGHAGAAP